MNQDVKDIIKLLLRSKDIGEGWRKVAAGGMWDLVKTRSALAPELFELNESDLKVRLSEKGLIVKDYI